MTTEILDVVAHQIKAFEPFYAQLAELKANNIAIAFNYESPKGNKEARSHIFKLRQSKGALEAARKSEKEESLSYGRKIDAEAKAINAEIEAMIAVHQVKIDEIEQREKDRISAIKKRRQDTFGLDTTDLVSVSISDAIREIEQVEIDESWQEFRSDVALQKDNTLRQLRLTLEVTLKREAEAAELARLRLEAEARAQKERDEAIAKAAEEKAKREAEALAARKEAEAKAAIDAAEAKAKEEREAAERRELALKLEAENAERRLLEGQARAAREAEEAKQRAEREKQQAIEQERLRAEAVKRAEEDAAAKREANKKHKDKINNAALDAFVKGGMQEEEAKLAITLIATGKIPAIAISY